MPEKSEEKGTGLDLTSIYLGFVGGMVLGMLLQVSQERRMKEKIRRHLERAVEEVDD